MLTVRMIVAMTLWPALAAAAVLGLAWVPAIARSRFAPLIAPAAIAIGFGVGYWVVLGAPALSAPVDAKARLPHVAGIGVAVAAVWVLTERRLVVWAATAAGALLATRLVLVAAIDFVWTIGQALLRVGLVAAGMLATVMIARGLTRTLPARAASLGLSAVAGLAAPLMLFSDSLLMAQLHGAFAIAVAVTTAAVWLAPQRIGLAAAAPTVLLLAGSHWVIALLFANMPNLSFALLVLALPAALATVYLLERWRPSWRAFGAIAALILLAGSSLMVGATRYTRTSPPSAQPAQDYGYGYDR